MYTLGLILIFSLLSVGKMQAVKTLINFSFLTKTNFFKLSFLVAFLSFSGMPPLLGFFAKFFLFFILLMKSNLWLVFCFLIFNLFTLYFYLQSTRHFLQITKRSGYKLLNSFLVLPVQGMTVWLLSFWFILYSFLLIEYVIIYLCNLFT